MSDLTPIGRRLLASLDDEYVRMQNQWFFKWHAIGDQSVIEIDRFRGEPIRYRGVRFSGSPRAIYWDTIQYYLRRKIETSLDDLEKDLQSYSPAIRGEALSEAIGILGSFATKIRTAAVKKDRILRGNGMEFPPEQDLGQWQGCEIGDIKIMVERLRRIHCELPEGLLSPPQMHSSVATYQPVYAHNVKNLRVNNFSSNKSTVGNGSPSGKLDSFVDWAKKSLGWAS